MTSSSLTVTVAVVAAGLMTSAPSCRGQCEPARMVKVVFKDSTPGVDSSSFAAKPKTLYRLGIKYGRLEEELDAQNGIHGLMVINEPDVWMINLASKTGRHIVDSGPTFEFHSPVIASNKDPKEIIALEHGCEFAYMKAKGKQVTSGVVRDGTNVDEYELVAGPMKVVVGFKHGTQRPVFAELFKGPELSHRLTYLEYDTDLPPNTELFTKPTGATIQEP